MTEEPQPSYPESNRRIDLLLRFKHGDLVELFQRPLEGWLPSGWSIPTCFFWMVNSHLLNDQLALVSRLWRWIDEGLTLEDIKAIYAKLTASERAAKHRFAADLLADLAAEVAEVLKRRRIIEAQTRRRDEVVALAESMRLGMKE